MAPCDTSSRRALLSMTGLMKFKPSNIHYILLNAELEQMSDYLSFANESIENYRSAFEKLVDEQVSQQELSDKEAFYHYDSADQEIMQTSSSFANLIFTSFVMVWYSFVEQKLLELCDRMGLDDKVELVREDKGIKKVKKLLSKGAMKYSIDQSSWTKLELISGLRNLLVHQGNCIPCSLKRPNRNQVKSVRYTDDDNDFFILVNEKLLPSNLCSYMQKNKILGVPGPKFIEIQPSLEYCQQLIVFGQEFFEKLFKDLKQIS